MTHSNNMVTLAHVNVAGAAYNVYISMNTESHAIHIFKYNKHSCDYGVFMDGDSACDFINEGMATGQWAFRED